MIAKMSALMATTMREQEAGANIITCVPNSPVYVGMCLSAGFMSEICIPRSRHVSKNVGAHGYDNEGIRNRSQYTVITCVPNSPVYVRMCLSAGFTAITSPLVHFDALIITIEPPKNCDQILGLFSDYLTVQSMSRH